MTLHKQTFMHDFAYAKGCTKAPVGDRDWFHTGGHFEKQGRLEKSREYASTTHKIIIVIVIRVDWVKTDRAGQNGSPC